MILTKPYKWKKSADVIIVGYGGAGAVAAITAHDEGANVLILEKQPSDTPTEIRHTPSTRMCGGLFICPTNVSEAAAYLEACCWRATSRSVCEAWAKYAVQNVGWLRNTGAEVFEIPHLGAEFPRFPGAESIKIFSVRYKGATGGAGLFWLLSDQVNLRGVKVMYNTPAKELVVNNKGETAGVVAKNEETEIAIKAKRAVILTCGGFEWNEEMKLNYLRGTPFYFYCNPSNTGDGIKIAQKVGAALWHMNTISGRVVPKFPNIKPAMAGGTPANRFIFVDKHGRRFAKERPLISHSFWLEVCYFDAHRAEYPRIPCYSIFDEVARQKGPVVSPISKGVLPNGEVQYFYNWSAHNTIEIEKGWIIRGKTIEELATKLGIRPKILEDTITEYNQYCQVGEDSKFNRREDTLVPIDASPYYALKMYPGGPNTQGGPKRNPKSQVLDVDDKPIPRLYSAGELGSIYGFLYPASGGNVAELIASGRIAGINAAAESPWC